MRKPYQVRDATPSSSKHKMGVCILCGKDATKEALFKGGVIIIEKYCSECLESEKFSSRMTFYAKNG